MDFVQCHNLYKLVDIMPPKRKSQSNNYYKVKKSRVINNISDTDSEELNVSNNSIKEIVNKSVDSDSSNYVNCSSGSFNIELDCSESLTNISNVSPRMPNGATKASNFYDSIKNWIINNIGFASN